MRRETHHEYENAEAREERYQDEVDRRDRHLPIILESDNVDIPWLDAEERKCNGCDTNAHNANAQKTGV